MTPTEVRKYREYWDSLYSGSNAGRVLAIGETGPELIIPLGYGVHSFHSRILFVDEARALTNRHSPKVEPTYTPTVQRIDWLAELRDTKRQAMVGAAVLGALVLVLVIGGLRLAGVL